jgi:hypothetical protein
MALNIDWECVETKWKCLISKLLLPLSPLIIEDIIEGRNCIPLLPFGKEIDVC